LLQVNAANPACNGSTVWTNYSDGRLKENVKPLEGGVLDKLTLLKPSTFNYNDKYFSLTGYDAKTKNTLYGFIAQDIIKVFPDMVNERELKDGNKYYDTNLSSLQIYLVKAIQEMNEKISGQRKAIDEEQRQLDKLENLLKDKERAVDGLEKRVAALEEKIKQLEKKRRVAI